MGYTAKRSMLNPKIVRYAMIGVSLLFVSIFLLEDALAQDSKSTLHVVAKEVNAYESYFFVVKKGPNGEIDKTFHEIPCFAQENDYQGECKPYPLANGKFLLADCFVHSTVAQSCRLVRFNHDGTQDDSFKVPFSSSHRALVDGYAENEINSIESLSIQENGTIQIEGEFISPLIGWTNKQARAATEIGDDIGKTGIILLGRDSQFISFSSKSSK